MEKPNGGDKQVARPDQLAPYEKSLTATEGRGLYRTINYLDAAYREARRGANLLAPIVRIDYLPPLHAVSMRVIVLNPTPPDAQGKGGGGHVYKPDPASPDLALTKVALDMVAAAAGISWEALKSGRLDDHSDPWYCAFRRVGWVQDYDGSRREIVGEKEIDLRDYPGGLAAAWKAKGWQKRLDNAREHILRQCESKAANAAIRQALAIKSKYTPEELSRPFVVPKLVFAPDLEHLDDRTREIVVRMMVERGLGVTQQLYGPEAGRGVEPLVRDMERRPPPPPPTRPAAAIEQDPDAEDAAADQAATDAIADTTERGTSRDLPF